jgi:hypothetical protein
LEFREFPKLARLSREIVITEKLDGTNASVYVFPRPVDGCPGSDASQAEWESAKEKAVVVIDDCPTLILAGSRTRWITPEDDNFGFAAWVKENAEQLAELGPGHHFGEWWGRGIQRTYGLAERRFSLFNTGRWVPYQSGFAGDECPPCCGIVPILYRGEFNTDSVQRELDILKNTGSRAAPGFMDPEGVVVYHTAAGVCFKKTLGDDDGKWKKEKKPREPRAPRDPNVGGRRKGPTEGCTLKRRKTDQ